jgi:hypothetical protein
VNACVNAVHDVGWGSATQSSYPLSSGLLYLFLLPQLSHDATLMAFGAYGNNATPVNAQLAVYSGTATSPSGSTAIAAVSSAILLSNATGQPMEETPIPSGVTLSASSRYWLGIIVQNSTTIYSSSDANGVGTAISASYGSWPAGSTGINKSGVDLGIYVNVQDLN